jgi:hypothetical protein
MLRVVISPGAAALTWPDKNGISAPPSMTIEVNINTTDLSGLVTLTLVFISFLPVSFYSVFVMSIAY